MFCVADSIANHAVSAVQALPACTLTLLRGGQGIMCEESGLEQQNLDGLVTRALAPKRLISISATSFLRDLLTH